MQESTPICYDVDSNPLLKRELPARGSAVRTNANKLRNSGRLDGENSDVRPALGSLSELPPSSGRPGSLIMSKKYVPYSEKLKDQRWQKKRLELLEAADWKCESQGCGSEDNASLHIHHKVYLHGKEPWEYENWAYAVLCDECHCEAQQQMEMCHTMLAQFKSLRGLLFVISKLPEPEQERFFSAQFDTSISMFSVGFGEGVKTKE